MRRESVTGTAWLIEGKPAMARKLSIPDTSRQRSALMMMGALVVS